MISKGELARHLGKLKSFEFEKFERNAEKERIVYEQYSTDSEIAATIIWNALQLGDIENKVIADLGAGTGILGIGALLQGAKKVYFVEKNIKAIEILMKNLESEDFLEDKRGIIVNEDVENFKERVDIVLTNPPFGTKRKHSDRVFVEKACEIAKIAYSFHKSETLEFIYKVIERKGKGAERRWDFDFPLKATMSFHKSRIRKIAVSCIRFL